MVDKKHVFEYFVYRLDEWRNQLDCSFDGPFSKLRLQKILFLVCASKATVEDKKLLNIYNRFFALPYGPVEMDIYEAMKMTNAFRYIHFNGNDCEYDKMDDSMFEDIPKNERMWIDEAIQMFKKDGRQYLTMSVFDLVEITHKWTVWKNSMSIAHALGHKQFEMMSDDICESSTKSF